jgi:hypothetical protein
MSLERFAIIAGSNKCGTTSLFHYLSDHPQICPSRRKELLFFAADPSGPRAEVLQRYRSEFTAGKPGALVGLEASPQYLPAGARRAANIREYLPDAKLIFILRDPVARLVSYYRTDFGQSTRSSYGLRFEEVVELGLGHLAGRAQGERSAPFANEIRMGQYADHLPGYAASWPAQQLKVVFFEDLLVDMRATMRDVAEYLGIDPRFYDSYVFEAENRTRGHRSRGLQRAGLALNRMAEPLLIRFHGLKRRLRNVYNAINEAPIDVPIEAEALARLRSHYEPSILALRTWMHAQFPRQCLPSWLSPRSAGVPS